MDGRPHGRPGLLVSAPFAGERVLEAVRVSRGGGVAVSDRAIVEAMRLLQRSEGISASPEAAVTYAALPELLRSGATRSGETALIYLTASGIHFSVEALSASISAGEGSAV
jgi:threonine synthase